MTTTTRGRYAASDPVPRWAKMMMLLTIAALVVAIAVACGGDTASTATEPEPVETVTVTAEPVAEPEPLGVAPDQVGENAADARATLRGLGYTVETLDAVEDRVVLMESNWTVVTQSQDGDTVVLGVEKPGDHRSDESDEELDVLIFTMLAEENIPPLMDAETCELIDFLGTDMFVASFREGFEESGSEWRPEYDDIVDDMMRESC